MKTLQSALTTLAALCIPAIAFAVPPGSTPTGGSAPHAAQAEIGKGSAPSPAAQRVANKIYAANNLDENHRINGPQVVYGATRTASGSLKMIELKPGTRGYAAAVSETDHRLNGSPPIFNSEGKIVFQPKNTPIDTAALPAKLTLQPKATAEGARAPSREVQQAAAKIYAANNENETHRIDGPQVVYGATKEANGELKMVELRPGTKGYAAAVGATDDRLNGSPPIFNAEGKIVFQPHNTPLGGAAK